MALPKRRQRTRAAFLCALFLGYVVTDLHAQAPRQPIQPGLRLIVVEGNGGINNYNTRTATDVVVRVENEKGVPVAGATVSFQLPTYGPSGRFADGNTVATAMTDSEGRARATGMQPNNQQGDFEIVVSASFQGRTTGTTLTQTNLLTTPEATTTAKSSGGGHSKKWIAILAVAAGGAVGATFALRQSGSSTPSSSSVTQPVAGGITITPGTPTVGAPR